MHSAMPCKLRKISEKSPSKAHKDPQEQIRDEHWQRRDRSQSPRMAKEEVKTVHFATLKDSCHLKNSDLEKKFPKYKGRVVLNGDVAKDD